MRIPIIIVLSIVMLGASPSDEKKKGILPTLKSQIARFSSQKGKIIKTISEGGKPAQTREMQWGGSNSESVSFNLSDELTYLLEYDPFTSNLGEYFQSTDECGCILTQRMPGKESKTHLEFQNVKRDPVTGNVTFVESKIKKDNALYHLEVYVRAFFDSRGNYQYHDMELRSSALFSGEPVKTKITGLFIPQ